jgi:D-alanyl-D-alanine carboxypeptidase/D-alanyl-D-alanine carboxypeptidase (penicillin-binding protein 5/6)
MAKLMFYCMENENFKDLVSCHSAEIKGQTYTNHNKLLINYPGCIGGKTGFTSAAGRCLVTCCERNGIRLVCVTLADADDWQDHMSLYDYAYANYNVWSLCQEVSYQVQLISGNREKVSLVPKEELKLFLKKNEKVEIKADYPPFIFAPVKIGETAGEICVIIKNKVVAQIPLVYEQNAVMAYPCLNRAALKGAI